MREGTKAQASKELATVTQQSGFGLRGAVLQIQAPKQWFSTRGDFVPRGHLAKSKEIFGCHNWGAGGYYWHLMGKGQRCC